MLWASTKAFDAIAIASTTIIIIMVIIISAQALCQCTSAYTCEVHIQLDVWLPMVPIWSTFGYGCEYPQKYYYGHHHLCASPMSLHECLHLCFRSLVSHRSIGAVGAKQKNSNLSILSEIIISPCFDSVLDLARQKSSSTYKLHLRSWRSIFWNINWLSSEYIRFRKDVLVGH